ncbi:hypothetical protein F5884DRAFT_714366 [Xylogone sp. PMI_703]|nr:hypothetical protein F5884DRAFT_714366 [Xylogone sp. PMI_703]
MASQSILLVGAGGYLGRQVAKQFVIQKSKFSRVAILTDPSKIGKYAEEAKSGIEVVGGSFLEPESFKGFNTVICMVGNHAMASQPAIIDATISGGVTHFYPSEFGSDIGQGPYLTNRYFRDKHITRDHLKKAVDEHKDKGFGYTLMITGPFTEYAVQPTFGFYVDEAKFEMFGSETTSESFTAVTDVAKYVVASVLKLPPPGRKLESPERIFRVPTATHYWREIVDMASRIQGKEYTRIYHPNSEALQIAAKYAKEGDVDSELLYSLKAIVGHPEAVAVPKPWDNDKFPDIIPESFEDTLRRALETKL